MITVIDNTVDITITLRQVKNGKINHLPLVISINRFVEMTFSYKWIKSKLEERYISISDSIKDIDKDHCRVAIVYPLNITSVLRYIA